MPAKPEPAATPSEPGFTHWPWWRRWFGRRSEKSAARFLRSLGYRVLAANVSDPAGELDLLALDRETLVVVEVRSTASDRPNAIEQTAASVDLRKQRKITGATLRFLNTRKLLGKIAVRFDVLVLSWPAHSSEPVIRHIPHAFEAVGKFQMLS
ncbi:MAG TPA: YraN family protein [Gemmata sp.]|jgi:putative endonuclease|nr:YraN family protein [Gemmata sp.]